MKQRKLMAEKMTDEQIERMLGQLHTNPSNLDSLLEYRDTHLQCALKYEEAWLKAIEQLKHKPVSIYKKPEIPHNYRRVQSIGGVVKQV